MLTAMPNINNDIPVHAVIKVHQTLISPAADATMSAQVKVFLSPVIIV